MKRLLSGIVFFAAISALWMTLGTGDSLQIVPQADAKRAVKSYLHGATRWRYAETGDRSQTIELGVARQYTDHPATLIEELRFEGPDDNGRYWQLTSGAGKYRPGVNELQLTQGVEIRESLGEGVMTTPILRLKLDEKKAATRAKVRLETENSVTTAIGLSLDLNSGRAELLRDVKTLYEG